MPKFAQGNSKGRGGKRVGAGRKPPEIREAVKDWKTDVESLNKVMAKLRNLALNSQNENVSVAAAREYLDRVVGKARQQVDLSPGSPLLVELYKGLGKAGKSVKTSNLLDPETTE